MDDLTIQHQAPNQSFSLKVLMLFATVIYVRISLLKPCRLDIVCLKKKKKSYLAVLLYS